MLTEVRAHIPREYVGSISYVSKHLGVTNKLCYSVILQEYIGSRMTDDLLNSVEALLLQKGYKPEPRTRLPRKG